MTAVSAKTAVLRVDWTRCDGHGLCAAILPRAITTDDWGYPVVDDAAVAAEPTSAVRRAVGLCPAMALRQETRLM